VQSWANRRENGPQRFLHLKSFFQLNKSVGENKNRRNTWGPQENVKFCVEIDLNIATTFVLGTLTKGQPYSNENYISVWGLNLMKTGTEISLYLTQIQDYTMTNT
jgi:hypothetical protein